MNNSLNKNSTPWSHIELLNSFSKDRKYKTNNVGVEFYGLRWEVKIFKRNAVSGFNIQYF